MKINVPTLLSCTPANPAEAWSNHTYSLGSIPEGSNCMTWGRWRRYWLGWTLLIWTAVLLQHYRIHLQWVLHQQCKQQPQLHTEHWWLGWRMVLNGANWITAIFLNTPSMKLTQQENGSLGEQEIISHTVFTIPLCNTGWYWPLCRWEPTQTAWHGPLATQGASAGCRLKLPSSLSHGCYVALKERNKMWNITFLTSKCLMENHREAMWFQKEGNRQWDSSSLCNSSSAAPLNQNNDLKITCKIDLLKSTGQLLPALLLSSPE